MKAVKSYSEVIDNKGYVYKQRLRINEKLFDYLNDTIRTEIELKYPRKEKYVFTNGYETFLKSLKLVNNQIVFLNSTQLRFINLFLELKLSDMNSYLYIKGE